MFVSAGLVEGDAPTDTVGDAVTDAVKLDTGLPDTDDVRLDAGLPDTDDVRLGAGLPDMDDVYDGTGADTDADGVHEPVPDVLGVGFKMATLRAVMVAFDTPASLASQE